MRGFFLTNACQFTNELRERQILRGLGLAAILTLITAGHLQEKGKLPAFIFGQTATTSLPVANASTVTSSLLLAAPQAVSSVAPVTPTSFPLNKIAPVTTPVLRLPPNWSFEKGTLTGSFNNSAKLAGLTAVELKQLNRIFADKVDFRHLRKGDSFNVITERHIALNPKEPTIDNVIAAELTIAHHRYSAVRFVAKNAQTVYLQMDGTGLAPGFLRYPVHYTRIGSGFNLHRLDPVTGIYHAHPAIDFDAPVGTPIQATGDGKISFANYEQGYGNVIKIMHPGQVLTLYAHMRNFAKGVHVGSTVTKGQVIGYVGTSGYTTGPHVHYELHFGSKPVNPLTTKLPSSSPVLTAQDHTNFNKLVNQLRPFLS